MVAKTDAAGVFQRRRGSREALLFALVAGLLTLWVACRFYASMRLQIQYTSGAAFTSANDWSAPLDDVFIHFDFARAIARGHPFEWSEGNGYSSGGTSLLYPFVLAIGYLVGFRHLGLMVWAGVVACVSTLGLLLASRRLFRDLPRVTSYLAPIAILGVGVLDWSLFSGMEVAFFLAIWGGALIAWDDLLRGTPGSPPPERKRGPALLLGFWCALLVATRPESAVVVAVMSLEAGVLLLRSIGWRRTFGVILASALPGALILVAQAVANKIYTGDASAAGALVKLELNHPHMSAHEVWEAWQFHSKYQLLRVAEYHLSDAPGYGWIPFVLGGVALFPRATRRYAILLWASAVAWVLTVALNGQVRWQNERYTMPALAWVLLAAALGVAVLTGKSPALGRRGLVLRGLASAVVAAALALFAWHQAPKFRDQVWFFGRASRNIRDQHIRAGRLLRNMLPEPPRRVLVGDAGAIPYASDLPALDIIGLGGYHDLPFARATRDGIGAAVELLERMPAKDRPDMLAIYPSWFGVFPVWFGTELTEVPVSGNVICGGAAKVLYRPDWSSFEGSAQPSRLTRHEIVVDELDLADVVSERAHRYRASSGSPYVEMKLLPNPAQPERDLFDAGRIVLAGASERFELAGFERGKPVRLVFRLAPAQAAVLKLRVNGQAAGEIQLEHSDGWIEPSSTLPASQVEPRFEVELSSAQGGHIVYHLWAIQVR